MNDNDENLHELTRQKKNICEKCGTPKQMYYTPWCPICEKPKVKMVKHLNFLQCMYHLEAIGHVDIKKRMWDYCYNYDYMKSNDSCMVMHIPTQKDIKESSEVYDPDDVEETKRRETYIQHDKDMKLIAETFDLNAGDEIHFWVSW